MKIALKRYNQVLIMQRSRGHPIVKKLLFPLMAAFAIMANT
ncbi:DsbC family protein, partial [Escherichia coli]|nr:DsbC family protein [Escherichia coli]